MKDDGGVSHDEYALREGEPMFFPANPTRSVLIISPRGIAAVEWGLGTVASSHGVQIKPHDAYDFAGNPPKEAFWVRSTSQVVPTVIIEG